ncbi:MULTISPECIES: PLP-dependent cysteine synthase family protein [Priestia]|jgi:cystathionine beta-synthase (O-acetyl-L-serine)|uniref:O-acetylserine dependent cystathionine beta-synthase n=2 Tax=Priestia TaxID=2800373 RepID=A0AAX6BQJ3_PRIMG|nr:MULTISPECIES: cysteine synthase family protein [Priestia]MBK0292928.1 cysteine synthase family protein [Bacillus sp. S34]MCL9636796.1 cysteine synthase family protein [Bacillus zanthoxyli]UPK50667.1 cysteine synthase family protein [Bacillus sp. H8-1]KML29143.1 cysteine synthase [Priestia aryabhattai]KMO01233.1 cysteine synthase [Priestia aryabhattai]
MKVVKNVHELIGNTPMIEITQFDLPREIRIFAKLEYVNPGGSVKDRLGKELLQEALGSGRLKRGGTLVEPTAGNTGIGLALAALQYEINVILCVPEKFSIEKQQLMKALGATVVQTPTEAGMKGAINKAQELLREIPGSYCPQQFANPANPMTYYKTLGPEIYEQLDGKVDVFVAGAGTGGTFMGTAKFLKEKNPSLKTVIVEPEGSILNGGKSGPHLTEGIGMEFIPDYMERSYFNAIHTVEDVYAFQRVKELALKEGLLVGSSSGAAFEAALIEAKNAEKGAHIVTIFPDSSERYLSKNIYSGGR